MQPENSISYVEVKTKAEWYRIYFKDSYTASDFLLIRLHVEVIQATRSLDERS